MGFLDELRRQAEAARSRQDSDQQLRLDAVQAVDGAARALRQCLRELAEHLALIRPAPPVRYEFDRACVLDGLPRADFRSDARLARVLDIEVVDHLHLACRVRGEAGVRLRKDFVNETERLERRLAQAGVPYVDREEVRDEASQKLRHIAYAFDAVVEVGMRVECHHARRLLHFRARNLDGLETTAFDLRPEQVDAARLDDLARWWVGERHGFLDGAMSLRRADTA